METSFNQMKYFMESFSKAKSVPLKPLDILIAWIKLSHDKITLVYDFAFVI